jgi:hypothetical protein
LTRLSNAYMRAFARAAQTDGHLTYAFRKVTHLLASPISLFAPRIALRVLMGVLLGTLNRRVITRAVTTADAKPIGPSVSSL